MIYIKEATYKESTDSFVFSFETTEGYNFTNFYMNTLEDRSNAIDLSEYLLKESNIEEIEIPLEDLEIKFNTIYIFELKSNDETEDADCCCTRDKSIFPLGNYTDIHNCILNKILKADVIDCELVVEDPCGNNILYYHALLESLLLALKEGYYEEASKIYKSLKEYCESCPCNNSELKIGTSIAVIKNQIVW